MSAGRQPRPGIVALLALVLVGVSACTGVPTSSRPQAIQSVGLGEGQSALPIRPQRNADPLTIVKQFLGANGVGADHGYSDEKQFLSKQGNQGWSPSTATIVADDESIGTYDPRTQEVVVTGRVIGTVNAAGEYQPVLSGTGNGGPQTEFRYKVQLVGGQYRITTAQPGLLLTSDQFRDTFTQRVLYYFDTNNRYLVPVLRYSALSDPTRIAEWLLDELAATSPPADVQNVVDTDTFPTQARRVQVNANGSDGVQVQITGSAELPAAGRDLLAAQVSQTLDGVLGSESMSIYDGQRAVAIPHVNGTRFNPSDFAALRGPPAPSPVVYYLATSPLGRIRTATGKPIAGPVARNAFVSVALARPAAIGQLSIAGVQVTGTTRSLVVGTQFGGVEPTTVRGDLCRPAWAPGRPEVWVASGSTLYRVTTDGRRSTAARVQVPFTSQAGRIIALRLSPDGSRIAMVVSGARNSGQLFVGPILRTARTVQVGALTPISPEGVSVKDVAWIDAFRLIAIGGVGNLDSPHVFGTAVDGSGWSDGVTTGLPGQPESITITTNAHAWVSADRNVWRQGTNGWASPGPTGQTAGLAPVYLG